MKKLAILMERDRLQRNSPATYEFHLVCSLWNRFDLHRYE